MDSVEALVTEMRALSPVQLERVSDLVREMTETRRSTPAATAPPVLSQALIDRAVSKGWPAEIFSKARAGARPAPPIVREHAAKRSRGSKASVARAGSIKVIGRMDEDFTRPPQPPYETRTS